jgi:arsenate reductase (glutaredoxin)
MKVFTYEKCDTCRKALKYLDERGVAYVNVPIRETPPTLEELRKMLGYVGDLRRLFNTSGRDYKELNMKDRLPKLSEPEALALLAGNGNLVKRPFALTKTSGTTGFQVPAWETLLAG